PYEKQYIRKNGELVSVRLNGVRITMDSGEELILSVVEDVSEWEQAQKRIRLLAKVFEHSNEGFLITDQDNRIIEVNPAFTAQTGYALADVIGRDPSVLASGRTSALEYDTMWSSLRERGSWQGEIWDRHKDGHIYPKWLSVAVIRDEKGKITHHIASFTDITESKAAEERIHYLAHHDPLTRLPNRFSLQGRLDQVLAVARRDHTRLAVMFIDMDRFKNINDTLGHQVGDALLVEVARRLEQGLRASDIVARLGGDEFIVVLPEIERAALVVIADKIMQALGRVYGIDGRELHSTPSIGISVFPEDGETVEELMKNADTAMYHAKSAGRNNYQFFAASMNADAAERVRIEAGLRQALERGELLLHYQPQVEIATGRVVAVEALVRWAHPNDGLIPPMRFIPVAEDTGLIGPLGDWVLNEALRQLAQWRAHGVANLRMAVNLSAQQLGSEQIVETATAVLARHGLSRGDLELEITESVAMQHPRRTAGLLSELRDQGIELAIDDFGTGYSSLAYLKQLPLDRLKLDRSFVMDIEHDANDAAISAATISLAHSLGLAVVAEGVESAAQLDFLQGLGCDIAQGYFFSKPLPAEECLVYLRKSALSGRRVGVPKV
ncbi:MAG TPA: EAL domain-containing protein, partial [Rhodocyclaceae bacterium]|nr:EAL domain-containing protein [Rhodocyclaceae bacterium]